MLRRLALAALTLAAPVAALPAHADTKALERTFLERAAIAASDERCSLFSPGERLALRSGLDQARNELLRNGYAAWKVSQTGEQAKTHARSLGCDHPAVRQVAAVIRDSYRQFQKINYYEYPGKNGLWASSRSIHDGWGLKQQEASGAIFGLRRGGPASTQRFKLPTEPGAEPGLDLRLALAIPAAQWDMQPATVQLRVRDPAKLGEPWLGGLGARPKTLTAPPRSVSRIAFAGGVEWGEDNVRTPFWTFYFPAATLALIDTLDPREAIVLEVSPSPRSATKEPKTYLFEAGDFRPARTFTMIPTLSAAAAVAAAPAAPAAGGH